MPYFDMNNPKDVRRKREMTDDVMLAVGGMTRNKAEKAVEAVMALHRLHVQEDAAEWRAAQIEKQRRRGVRKVRGAK